MRQTMPIKARTAPEIVDDANTFNGKNVAHRNHTEITKETTYLWVTSSLYLRWTWMARNRSALRAMTPKNEAEENKIPESENAVYTEQDGPPLGSGCKNVISNTMHRGWTSKPTPRSEMAKLIRSVFRGFDNDEVLLNACIVTLLNMMAVTDSKAFITQ